MHEESQMRLLAILSILMTCYLSSHGVENNLTVAEVPIKVPVTADDDSEQELSSQLQEVDGRAGEWSSWSEWSACSRSCDGGVSHQLRTCKMGSCRGEHVRYKICNMQSAVVLFVALAVANAGLAPIDSAAVLSGPSGTVVRSGAVAAPVVAAAPAVAAYAAPYAAPYAAYAAPIVRSGIIAASPVAYAAVPAGSGLEGQWIPDINEKLYDDGSYKPHIYGF